MTDSITPITHAQIVSNYTRTTSFSDKDVVTTIKHVEDRGVVKVEAVSVTTYNKQGEVSESSTVGSRIDIKA